MRTYLDDAEKRFTAILTQDPANGRAAAGMGFLRMQQKNFGDAVNYLTRAEANGFKDRSVIDALATSHFWYVMGEVPTQASSTPTNSTWPAAKFREALRLRPCARILRRRSTALAGLLTSSSSNTPALR